METEAKRGAGNGAGSLKVSAKVQFIAPGLVLFLSYLEKAELKRSLKGSALPTGDQGSIPAPYGQLSTGEKRKKCPKFYS